MSELAEQDELKESGADVESGRSGQPLLRLFLALLLALGVGAGAAAYYTRSFDPETRFVTAAMQRKIAYAAELDRRFDRKIVFVGGSSCAFSVSPEILREEFGMAAVNMGILASTGRAFQIDEAVRACNRGDLLVLAFETPFWSETDELGHDGIGSKVHWLLKDQERSRVSALASLGVKTDYPVLDRRPGLRNLVTNAAKKLLQRPDFRYSLNDVDAAGWMATDYAEEELMAGFVSADEGELSFQRADLLRRIVRHAETIGCDVAVSIPWLYVGEESLETCRTRVAHLKSEIGAICLVLADSRLGAEADPDFFSDTGWHLSESGASTRTRTLGESIRKTFPGFARSGAVSQ